MDLKVIIGAIIIGAAGLFILGAFVHTNPAVFASSGAWGDIAHGFYHLAVPGP